MAGLSVTCPDCSLSLVDIAHPDVTYERDGDGQILCPNCKIPMKPVGERQTLAAEDAFAEAQRELATDAPPLPPEETTETLTKRLREIEIARGRVMAAGSSLEHAKKEASDARKDYDHEVETFLSLCGRLTSVSAPLPLFTQAAEQAAQATPDAPIDPRDESWTEEGVTSLAHALADAGAMIPIDVIRAWTPRECAEASQWTQDATVDNMPACIELATAVEQATTAADVLSEATTV